MKSVTINKLQTFQKIQLWYDTDLTTPGISLQGSFPAFAEF